MKRIGKYDIRDHGNENSQYFQGYSAFGTGHTECVTGSGDTLEDAINDAIEMIAQGGEWDVDTLSDRIAQDHFNGTIPDDGSANESALESAGYDDDSAPEEPDREDFDSDEEYDEAYSEWESEYDDWESERDDYNEVADTYRYVSIIWSEPQTETCTHCEAKLTDEDLSEGYTVCEACDEDVEDEDRR